MDLPGSGAVESANRRSSHSTPSIRSMAQRHASGSVDPLRMKVVEILAGTANGCVSELGYQPGTLQKIQTLETLNSQWQAENVRLYEDNRKLLQSIEIQKDHLKYLSADPEANRVKHIQDLEERVRVLTIERAELWKQNQSLLAGKTDPNYRWLQEEYKRLADMYRVAQNEIEHLRGFVRTGALVPQTYEAAHATRMQGGQPLPAPPLNHQNNRGQGIALPHPTSGPVAGPSMPRRSTGQSFPQPSSQSGAYVQYGLPERHMVQIGMASTSGNARKPRESYPS
ncbi:hypothetical protein BD779DRAFT_404950 [Infundibulicybe gibba]|nr:hypothetical protein BD779DRAFT_404950 [Infundibulicybe gibba]